MPPLLTKRGNPDVPEEDEQESASQHESSEPPQSSKPAAARRMACNPCRTKKMRCNGQQPACALCSKSGRQCSYSNERRKPRGAPSTASLSAKLEALQERLQSMLLTQSGSATPSNMGEGTSPLQLYAEDRDNAGNRPVLAQAKPTLIEFSKEDRDKILAIFFQYQHRLAGSIDSRHFMQTLDAEDESLRPHPALLGALLLNGIMMAELSLQSHLLPFTLPEPAALLSRIHHQLSTSLELVDRLFDYIQASILLCGWYTYQGRLQEAQYFSSSTFRLAVDCHMHQISGNVIKEVLEDSVPSSFWDGTILGRPRSRYHLYLRVMLFWQCYALERMIGLVTGLPVGCDSVPITTVWPLSLNDFNSIVLNPGDAPRSHYSYSIDELLAGEIEDSLTDSRVIKPHVWQILVLLGKATRLKSLAESYESTDLSQLEVLLRDVNAFAIAVQRFESASTEVDKALVPYHTLTSDADRTAWCLVLQVRLGMPAIRVHLLRSVEATLKLFTALTGSTTLHSFGGIDLNAYSEFLVLVPKDGGSFNSVRFGLAQGVIKVIHEVARQYVEKHPEGFRSRMWLPHVTNLCGFMLPSMILPSVEYIHDLEAQQQADDRDAGSPGCQPLHALLADAEQTLSQGLEVLTLLSANMPILKIQVDKIETARNFTMYH